MKQLLLLTVLALTINSPAIAQNHQPYYPQHAGYEDGKALLKFSEVVSERVEQDRLKITLRAEVTHPNVIETQSEVNGLITQALRSSKHYGKVKTSTGTYTVHQVYNQRLKTHDKWRGQQFLYLDSASSADILKLSGSLQEKGFILQNMTYYLSQDKAATYKNNLLATAISRLQARAETIASQVGLPNVELVEVNVGNEYRQQPQHQQMARNMTLGSGSAKGFTPPSAQSGEETVSLTVNAVIKLSK